MSTPSEQQKAEALERVALAVEIAAGVQYELDRMLETAGSYDAAGDETQSVLRRAALALDQKVSADALKALSEATQNAEYFKSGKPSLEKQIAAVRRTAEAWRETATAHIVEARDLGLKVADVDAQIAGLAAEGMRKVAS